MNGLINPLLCQWFSWVGWVKTVPVIFLFRKGIDRVANNPSSRQGRGDLAGQPNHKSCSFAFFTFYLQRPTMPFSDNIVTQ